VKEYRSIKAGDDVLTITLDRALEMLAEPKTGRGKRAAAKPLRELGAHPEDGEPVNIYDGPYGPYIKHGKVNASLPEGETVEAIAMTTAVEALNAKAGTKKAGRSRKASTAATGETTKATKTSGTTKKPTAKKAAAAKKATAAKKTTTKKTTATTTDRKKKA
jgi:DNA topoisomerase-1